MSENLVCDDVARVWACYCASRVSACYCCCNLQHCARSFCIRQVWLDTASWKLSLVLMAGWRIRLWIPVGSVNTCTLCIFSVERRTKCMARSLEIAAFVGFWFFPFSVLCLLMLPCTIDLCKLFSQIMLFLPNTFVHSWMLWKPRSQPLTLVKNGKARLMSWRSFLLTRN